MKKEEKPKPLSLWIEGQAEPLRFENSLEAQKILGVKFQQVTSGSIEIVERNTVEGSTISGKNAAGLRNWAIKELDVCAHTNKKLSFFDVKYKPIEDKIDKGTGQVIQTYPARLIFRRSIPKNNE
jgi:hypothetical protein